ncbi:MAG TPA: tRNA (adenosine(37)-N6)-threonylcarbamoyltransferase complex ATPase subunit type 1 TsaE [Candidatus Cloacimonadota bacterium]|nr:tRNA (adenosine(37)-N6)-threonylcarbamoyltransferase complex ATPase subunit type 1 TsaE [Candidatus Cloacimonadota bacterium]HOQ81122.1 tRNA (adenosine(37)-N6)-threonylcarbamoyltransferase complex ATPase subunit type 1 TsaE [Candidatus Cloacimonadota bacterium]HPK40775.1 tRNA (adenosine(37)-N6)-threonylcarbamoyltransferase complex ATPase subunit type 1 TsaE [Candidatus Cloacimonadota bacterium]
MDKEYLIKSKSDTAKIAKEYAKLFQKGDVIALYGDLGVGKTFFVQSVCQALGIKEIVNSPSYVLLNQYSGDFLIKHFDLYRLQYPEEVYELGIFEDLEKTIIFIEWPQIAESILPANTWFFHFEYYGKTQRKLHIIKKL